MENFEYNYYLCTNRIKDLRPGHFSCRHTTFVLLIINKQVGKWLAVIVVVDFSPSHPCIRENT